ncbi:hypothetical protein ACFPIJ_53495 [Dactylosporangium cerinum]|uniref:Uncharacterized protein n=1 Tax=Dactylosporangium cerinum TaxID=1434730 RepID=A0ABV9WCZ7_9ACTN
MPPPDATYSIVVRVRRVTTEDAYIRVPVTDAVVAAELDADGHRHLDGGKVMAEARRLAETGAGAWQVQEQAVDLHPVQNTPPDGR